MNNGTNMESIERVRNLESELVATRKEAAKLLRAKRSELGLTIRQVSNRTRLAPTTIYNIETNKSWNTRTVAKVARFYVRAAA
jgi:DNA-binding XRE family transcriptional regulator